MRLEIKTPILHVAIRSIIKSGRLEYVVSPAVATSVRHGLRLERITGKKGNNRRWC